jgi:hypothetical protein
MTQTQERSQLYKYGTEYILSGETDSLNYMIKKGIDLVIASRKDREWNIRPSQLIRQLFEERYSDTYRKGN